jgi:peroxiredoxin Q/BCP
VVEEGQIAPDFEPSGTGQPVSLSSLRGRPVVLCVYPKDDSTRKYLK